MNPATLRVLSSLLEARTGQYLSEGRHWRVEVALNPILKAHEIASCDALAVLLTQPGGETLADETVDALLNNETYFFRDSEAFSELPKVIEEIATRRHDCKRLRIWSAGCSTGQEIYSLAMQFRENAERWRGWSIELLGSDISHSVINRARIADFNQFEIQRGLPTRHMLRWFEQIGDRWHLNKNLCEMVRFRRHNVLEAPPLGKFDLILCRNVLLYFPAANRTRALDNIGSAIAPDGALMLGAGETVLGYSDQFEILPEVRSLYRPRTVEPIQLRSHG